MSVKVSKRRWVTGRIVALGLLVASGTLAGGLAAIPGTSGASGATQLTTVTMATSKFIGQVGGQIPGIDPGLCAPYGIKVNLVDVNDAAAVAGQQNGSIQIGQFTAALQSISEGQGSNIVVLAYTGYPPLNAGGIWGPPSIKSAKGLVGKKLAGLAGGPDALTSLLMGAAGIKTSQYSVVQFGNITAYFASPTTGAVNAAWDVAPLPPSWVKAKFHNIVPLGTDLGYTQAVYLTASKSWAAAHPTVVEDFLSCYAAGLLAGRSENASVRAGLAAEISKYDLVSHSEALQVLPSFFEAGALELPTLNEAAKSTAFYAGTPANKSLLKAALAPQYLKAAGVQVTQTTPLGPTTW